MAIGMAKEQQQIADDNENYLEDQAVGRGEARRRADIDHAQAQLNNAAQPRGRWDADTQTFVPDRWGDAIREREMARQRKFYGDVIGGRRAAMDEIGEIADTDRRMKAMVQLDLNNYMAGAVKYSNGGVLPDSVRNFINRRMTEKYGQFGLRFDGQSTGILPGTGFAQDGSYVFKLGNGTDQRGNAMTQDQVLDGRQLHSLMYMNRESFGDDALERSRQTLRGNGLSSKEIAALEQDPIPDDIREKIAAGATYGNREARWEMQHRPITNADSLRAKGYFGDGGAGGRNIGGTTDGKATSRLFGRTGPQHSTISVFSTADGLSRTKRPGEQWQYDDPVAAEEVMRRNRDGKWKVIESNGDGKRYVNDRTGEEVWVKDGDTLKEVIARGNEKRTSGLTFDERKQLQDERIKAQQEQHRADQEALTSRSEQSRKEREIRERRRLLHGEIRSLTSGGRIKDKDRYKRILEELRKLDGDDDEGSQATPDKEHNNGGETWGRLTPEQIKRAKGAGATFDPKTGEIVMPDGRRKKV